VACSRHKAVKDRGAKHGGSAAVVNEEKICHGCPL